MRMTIGERLKERRKELHMTLEDVSKATGMPKSTIQRWESGAVTNMGQENLQKAAAALDTSVYYLQTGRTYAADRAPKPAEITESDIFEYLCGKAGYGYVRNRDSGIYFERSTLDVVRADENARKEILELTARCFGKLMQRRSVSFDELVARYPAKP